jgi:hypothetical protein
METEEFFNKIIKKLKSISNLVHVFVRSKSKPIFFLWSSAPLEPPVESPKAPAWPRDFELLERVSELKFGREKP